MAASWVEGSLVYAPDWTSPVPYWPAQVVRNNFSQFLGGLKAAERPTDVLVRYFGLGTYRFHPPKNLQLYSAKGSSVKTLNTKEYQQASEEIAELHALRCGATPHTRHHPVDMLNRSTWPASEFGVLHLPAEPTPEDMQLIPTTAAVASWLREIASNTTHTFHGDPAFAAAAARLCWDYTWHSCTLLPASYEEQLTAFSTGAALRPPGENTAELDAMDAAKADPAGLLCRSRVTGVHDDDDDDEAEASEDAAAEDSEAADAAEAVTRADDDEEGDGRDDEEDDEDAGTRRGSGRRGRGRGRGRGTPSTPARKGAAVTTKASSASARQSGRVTQGGRGGGRHAKSLEEEAEREEAELDAQKAQAQTAHWSTLVLMWPVPNLTYMDAEEDLASAAAAAAAAAVAAAVAGDGNGLGGGQAAPVAEVAGTAAEGGPAAGDAGAVPMDAEAATAPAPATATEPAPAPATAGEPASGSEANDLDVPTERPLMRYWGGLGAVSAAEAEPDNERAQHILYGGKLEVSLTDTLQWLRRLARWEADPDCYQQPGQSLGTPHAALLRAKEVLQARSNYHRYGEIGVLTRTALAACGNNVTVPSKQWPIRPPKTGMPIVLLRKTTKFEKPPPLKPATFKILGFQPPEVPKPVKAKPAKAAKQPPAASAAGDAAVAEGDGAAGGSASKAAGKAEQARRRKEAAARRLQDAAEGEAGAPGGEEGAAVKPEAGMLGKRPRPKRLLEGAVLDGDEGEVTPEGSDEDTEASMGEDEDEDSEREVAEKGKAKVGVSGKSKASGKAAAGPSKAPAAPKPATAKPKAPSVKKVKKEAGDTPAAATGGAGQVTKIEGAPELQVQQPPPPPRVSMAKRPKLKIEVTCKLFKEKVPPTEAEFQASYQRWAGEHNMLLSAEPQMNGQPWRPYELLKIVVDKGGFEAIEAASQWRSVRTAWFKVMDYPIEGAGYLTFKGVQAAYRTHLAEYERWLAGRDCPTEPRMVTVWQSIAGRNLGGDAAARNLARRRAAEMSLLNRGIRTPGGLMKYGLGDFEDLEDGDGMHMHAPAVAVVPIMTSDFKAPVVPMISTMGPMREYSGMDFSLAMRGRGRGRGLGGRGFGDGGRGNQAPDPRSRRVLVKFPPDTLLPTELRCLDALREVIPNIEPSWVHLSHHKSTIVIDLPTYDEARAALKALNSRASRLFPEIPLPHDSNIKCSQVLAIDRGTLMQGAVTAARMPALPSSTGMYGLAPAVSHYGGPLPSSSGPLGLGPALPSMAPDPYLAAAPVDPRKAAQAAAAAAAMGGPGGYNNPASASAPSDPRVSAAAVAAAAAAAAIAAQQQEGMGMPAGHGQSMDDQQALEAAAAAAASLPGMGAGQGAGAVDIFAMLNANGMGALLHLLASQGAAQAAASLSGVNGGGDVGQNGGVPGAGAPAGGMYEGAAHPHAGLGGEGLDPSHHGILDPIQPLTLTQPGYAGGGELDSNAAAAAAAAAAAVANSLGGQQNTYQAAAADGQQLMVQPAELSALLATLQANIPQLS